MRISGLLLLIMLVSSACNLSRTEVSSLPTASTVETTAVNATRTPILYAYEVHPTLLITSGTPSATLPPPPMSPTPSGTLPPPPLSLAIPTQMSTASVNTSTTPDQAVRNYYTLVTQGHYDLGWSMLTDAFKQKFNCCAPNYNYTDYVKWWDSVNTVEFGNVKTVSQNGDHAVVYAEFYYLMNDGRRSSLVGDPYIALVYDTSLNTWRFDDKRATP